MKRYIGTKIIDARPMTHGEYNQYRGWDMPPNEDQNTAGYLVEYLDGGAANDSRHAGYISWSPADVFARTYHPYAKTNRNGIGWAVKQLNDGYKVCRAGWNGKGMFLFLVPGSVFAVNRPPLLGIYPAGTEINYCPHVDMRTVGGQIVPWLCSQTDLLAMDWELAE